MNEVFKLSINIEELIILKTKLIIATLDININGESFEGDEVFCISRKSHLHDFSFPPLNLLILFLLFYNICSEHRNNSYIVLF